MAKKMQRTWNNLKDLYDRQPRWGAVLAGTAVLLGLASVHAAVSFTSALRSLYVLPIWLATRLGGRISGLALVVLSTFAGTMTEWQLGHGSSESIAANFIIRFIALGCLMMLIAQVER